MSLRIIENLRTIACSEKDIRRNKGFIPNSKMSSDRSASQRGENKNNFDLEKTPLNSKIESKVVIELKDKTIISNRLYVQRKN